MSPQKPPRLAIWLLNRSGFARQNPPLAGDLLEEFRNGRSAAWYLRQTIAVIFTGLARNARLFRTQLTATFLGWVTETGVSFALWRFDYPRQLRGAAFAITFLAVMLLTVWAIFRKVLRRIRPFREDGAESISEDETGLVMSGIGVLNALLMPYCVLALLRDMSLVDFILDQVVWLSIWINDILLRKS